MQIACIPQTQIPSSSRLFLDYLYDFERVRAYYRHPPSLSAARAAAEEIRLPAGRRAALVEALRGVNRAGGAAVEENLRRLAEPKTVVVATGQQVGLFGGPVLGLYKALTAIKSAARLRDEGLSAVPVFWLATEDHDFREVASAWFLDREGRSRRVEAPAPEGFGGAVGRARVETCAVEEAAAALDGFEHSDEAIALLRESYRDGATFGEAFARLFQAILGKRGLILLDPLDPGIRALAAPILQEAARRGPELTAALLARGVELERDGYHQQVNVAPNSSLLFRMDESSREPLKLRGDRFVGGGVVRSPEELAEEIGESPESFSPNALLRPVAQDYLLPTVAYVGGPAELAYLAQSRVVYDRLLGRAPIALPRAFFTILDQRAKKLLERYGLGVADCFRGPDFVRDAIAAKLTPAVLTEAFAERRREIEAALESLRESLAKFDPSLAEALDLSRRKMLYQLEKVEGKTRRETLRRETRAADEAIRLSESLYPAKTPQERVHGPLSLIARFSAGFLDGVYDAVNADCRDHQVLAF